ncbi:MAG: mannose-1-phosphate guanylyltransferase [Bacteroidia bacterium]
MKNNYCVIMAGGIGSRFWPMSRNNFPKQFIDILGTGKTLIRQTYERFLSVCPKENIYIVTNEAYLDHVFAQIPEIAAGQVLSEPQRRNTAPCVAYACMKIYRMNAEANIVIAPSDHVIKDEARFHSAVLKGLEFTAKNNSLLTIGIHPSRPDTGYGYIQFQEDNRTEEFKISKVKTFTEKPNLEMASFFLKSGEFLWNAGIFLWNAKAILGSFEELMPEMYHLFNDGAEVYNTPGEAEFIRNVYTQCKNISIDYGIMEKAKNVFVLSAEFGWSDLGTWKSLYEQLPHDEQGNAIVGQHVMVDKTSNCIVNMPKGKLAVIQGLENFIVVETENVLLICPKDDEQQVRNLVNDVKIKKGEKFV